MQRKKIGLQLTCIPFETVSFPVLYTCLHAFTSTALTLCHAQARLCRLLGCPLIHINIQNVLDSFEL